MQAQVEPHFLFNTLASVQYLTETDPPQASRLLGHLLAYLRAALPQLRRASTTLGQEIDLAEAYLNILKMRMGPRLAFDIDADAELRAHPFPPGLLISVVENAITHGLEPQAEGGNVRIEAKRQGDRLSVTVADTGAASPKPRLVPARASGSRTCATVSPRSMARGDASPSTQATPRGARASIEIPLAEHRIRMTTALIAEDEPLLRAQLKARLAEAWPELEIVAEAANGDEALEQARVAAAGHRFPRHPHAGALRPRGRPRARRRDATSCSSPLTTNTRSRRSTKARSTTC